MHVCTHNNPMMIKYPHASLPYLQYLCTGDITSSHARTEVGMGPKYGMIKPCWLLNEFPAGLCNKFTNWTLLLTSQHWFWWWLGVFRQQAITSANVDPDACRHNALLDHNELISMFIFRVLAVVTHEYQPGNDRYQTRPPVSPWQQRSSRGAELCNTSSLVFTFRMNQTKLLLQALFNSTRGPFY